MDKFLQALSYLLPTGFAWPREPGSVLMRVLRGVAGNFDELHRFTLMTMRLWLPHQVAKRLAEWEEACGLPDKCAGTQQTDADRRRLLLARLRGIELAYDDSSPAAPQAIADLCAMLGYTAVVRYNTPFRVGLNRTGDRLGRLDGILHVRVSVGRTPLRVGIGRVGDRLVTIEQDMAPLLCYLQRIVPARFSINVSITD